MINITKNLILLAFLTLTYNHMGRKIVSDAFQVGDKVRVTSGALEGCKGPITGLESDSVTKYKVTLDCSHFFRSGVIKKTFTSDYLRLTKYEKVPIRTH